MPQILDACLHLLSRFPDVLFLLSNRHGPAKTVVRARRRKNDFILRLRIILQAASLDLSREKLRDHSLDQSDCSKISSLRAASPPDQSALAVRSQEKPSSQTYQDETNLPCQEPASDAAKAAPKTSPQTDTPRQIALSALVSHHVPRTPTAAPKPPLKPYLPRTPAHCTNAIPYPSHLPQLSERERQLLNDHYE